MAVRMISTPPNWLPGEPPVFDGPRQWKLNVNTSCPITIAGAEKIVIDELKAALDEGNGLWITNVIYHIETIIEQSGLVCKEVEEYISRYKPKYLRRLEQLEVQTGDDLTREKRSKRKQAALREHALDVLEIRPGTDLVSLFECDQHYFRTVARLIYRTYISGCDSIREASLERDFNSPSSYTIIAVDKCPCCHNAAKLNYKERPGVPHHVGCPCLVLVNFT